MKVVDLGNAVKIEDIDLNDKEQCDELGRIAAHECVVFIDDKVTEDRLYEIQSSWGEPSRALMHSYVAQGKIKGRHWRDFHLSLSYISDAVKDYNHGMTRVSYEKTNKGRPTGIFTNGELDWHCDHQSYVQTQRIIGLMSLYGSENSQTTFLRTSEMYGKLNHEDKSMVDELICVWSWDDCSMAKGLDDKNQQDIVRYHMVPLDGMECPLVGETATGRKGIKFPSHSFSHFKNMTREESKKYRDHLWSLLNKPEYIYTRDWKDGQIMLMDQSITLHARPTNVKHGSNRTMVRMITHVNNLFDNQDPIDYVLFDGKKITQDEFAHMVDAQRRKEYLEDNK